MITLKTLINLLGLALTLVGIVLLYKYGQSPVKQTSIVYIYTEEETRERRKKELKLVKL